MPGRAMRKVFCQGYTRAGRREGKLIPCRMKGYQLANGTFYVSIMGTKMLKGLENQTTQMKLE